MNKSKFLKKSLAMLLAVMLVVAMIPLSAAAATTKPVISQVTVGKDNVSAKIDGTEISAEISTSAYEDAVKNSKELPVKILTNDGADTAVYGSGNEMITLNSDAGKMLLTEGKQEGSVITFPITISNTSADEDAEYTLTVTVKPASDNTDIETVKADGQISSKVDNTARTITIVMPYLSNVSTLKVVDKDSAAADDEIVIKTVDGAKVSTDNATVDCSAGKVVNVYSQAESKRMVTYKLKVTVAQGFAEEKNKNEQQVLQFKIPGQLEDTIVDGTASVAATAKHPTTGVNGIINVSMPYNTGKDAKGAALEELKLIPSFTTDLSGAKVEIKDATDAKNNVTLTSGKTSANLINAVGTGGAVTVEVTYTTANTPKTVTYTLNLIPSEKNPGTEITEFTIGGTKATTENGTVDGKNMSVEVGVSQNLEDATLTFIHSKNAVVSIPLQGKTGGIDGTDKTKTVYNAVNVTNPIVVRVVSEDGKTTTDYTLTVTKSKDTVDPKITSLILKDGKTEYKASLSGTTFTFNLPFTANPVKGKNMDSWELFYDRTYGTKLTSTSGELPTSGSKLATDNLLNEVIPNYVASSTNVGSIKVAAIDESGAEATTFAYTIKVVRADAQTGKTLSSVKATSVSKTEDMDAENTVSAVFSKDSSKNNVVTFTLPYKTYKDLEATVGSEVYASEMKIDAGSVAYLYDGTSAEKIYTVEDEENDTTDTVTMLPIDFTTLKAGTYTIYVLDEKAAFAQGDSITKADFETDAKSILKTYPKNVTKYVLKVAYADPRTGNTLSSFSLGEYGVATISGGNLNITVPASYADGNDKYEQLTPEFKVSAGASIYTSVTPPTTPVKPALVSGGVKNDDGKQIGLGTDANPAIKITKSGDTVTVNLDADAADKAITHLYVFDEGATTYTPYKLNVTVAEPEQGADLTAFSINNHAAKIAGKDVSLTLPYGTDLTNLVAKFTVSKMATAEINATEIFSGTTAYDYSTAVKLTVVSENKLTKNVYNIKITTAEQFPDVKEDDWFYNAVTKAAELGIVNGREDGTFAPNDNITRGDFAIMVVNMLGQDAVNEANKIETSPFTDVDIKNDWYAKAVAYCESKGYISGMGNSTFAPKANITRQQMAVILANVLELNPITNPTTKFADDASIATWAKGAVYACQKAGILGGMGANTFAPTANATRAQAATIFVNAHGMVK